MPVATRGNADLYAVLDVDASASGDEIARAFRLRAKQLHPDANVEPDAADRFNELVAAYDVLSNHRTRREYDQECKRPAPVVAPTAAAGTAAIPAQANGPIGARWSRRRAWTALVAGALVTLLGVGAAVLTWTLHQNDARRHAQYHPVTALRDGAGNISFTTADGRIVTTREPEQHGEGSEPGQTVGVRYDPADPTHVIVDGSTIGRDITLAIVALKFLIGGPVFVFLGSRRLRALGRRTTGVR